MQTERNFRDFRRGRGFRGFTIMELLIASVLSAILMIGILFATTQLARQVHRQKGLASPTQFNTVLELLRKDMSQATACRVTENKIHLRGFMLLDPQSQKRIEQPAQVIYRLVQINDVFWLMRHQRALNNLTLDDTDANLLCKNITTMQLLPPPQIAPKIAPKIIPAVIPDDQDDDENKIENISSNSSKDSEPVIPFEFTDQWQPLPQVVQWVITQPHETDDAIDEKTLTFTLVIK